MPGALPADSVLLDSPVTVADADARSSAVVLCGAGVRALLPDDALDPEWDEYPDEWETAAAETRTVLDALGVLGPLRDLQRHRGLRVVRG